MLKDRQHRHAVKQRKLTSVVAALLVVAVVSGILQSFPAPVSAAAPKTPTMANGLGTDGSTTGVFKPPSDNPNAVPLEATDPKVSDLPSPASTIESLPSSPPQQLQPGSGYIEGKSFELVGERNATTRVFQNPDGTRTARLYTKPINIKDDKGNWKSIDPNLREKNGRHNTTLTHAVSSFASMANDPALHTLKFADGNSVSYSLKGAQPAKALVAGSKVTYSTVLPGVTAVYTAQDTGVKEDLILDSSTAPDTYVFDLTLNGVTAAYDTKSGDVIFRDTKGAESGRLTHGWMEDAKFDPQTRQGALSDGIRYTLDVVNKRTTVTMHLDSAWLRDPARVFPVDVDPSLWTTFGGLADDTFVMSGFTADSGGLGTMKVGTYDGGAHVGAGYVRFDVGSLARTRVVGVRYNAYNSYSWSCNARGLGVYPVTQAWNGHTMTGYPGATYDAGNRVMWGAFAMGYNSSCPAGWAYWDNAITGMVQGWVDGTIPNFGLTLRVDPGSQNDNYAYKILNASELGGQRLDVSYVPYNASYTPSASFIVTPKANSSGSINVNVTNWGRDCWEANGTYRLSYHLYDDAENLIRWENARTFLPQTVCWGQNIPLEAIIDPLPPGNYRIAWDMVNEGNYWFSDGGLVPAAQQRISLFNAPALIVNGSATPINPVAATNRPTLGVTATDSDNWPGTPLAYTFKICQDTGMTVGCQSSGSTGASWTTPALYWNQPYYWTATVTDGVSPGNTAGPMTIIPRVTQPAVAAHLGGDAYAGTANGVNLAVGNYVAPFTDASIPGVGPSLEVARIYNSLDANNGAFGLGWSFNYGSRLIVEPSGTILLTYPDGRQGRFGLNPDGTYTGPLGYFAQLVTSSGTIAYKLVDKTADTYNYDASGRLISITSPAGISVVLAYDASGQLSTARNSASGRELSFTWAGGHVTRVTTSAAVAGGSGFSWTYAYTGNDLTTVCNPNATSNCSILRYTSVAGRDLLTQVVLPKGNSAVTLHYDANGVVDSRKDGENNTWTFASTTDGSGNKTAIVTDPLSHVSTFRYDTAGRLISQSDALNKTKSYEYNVSGYLAKATDANGNALRLATDIYGNVLSRTVQRNGAFLTSYYTYFIGAPGDPRNGKLTEFRDARSSSSTDNTYLTVYGYDARGRQTSLKTPPTPEFTGGRTSTWTYSAGTEATVDGVGTTPAGLVLSTGDPKGSTVAYTYDANGNQRRVIDALGLKTETAYDRLGRPVAQTEYSDSYPAGLVKSFTFDSMNRVLTQTDPVANSSLLGSTRQPRTTYTYNPNGSVSSVVASDVTNRDAARTVSYAYDNADRIVAEHNPTGGVSSTAYDAAGNVATKTTPLGVVTAYSYSDRNELLSTTVKSFVDDPIAGSTARNLQTEARVYDAAGRLDRSMDAVGRTTQYQYFEDDSPAKVILLNYREANGSVRNVTQHSYSYDAAGNQSQVVNGNGLQTINNAFNAANEITRTTLDPGGLNRTLDYLHDGNGNVARTTVAQGSSWRQTWTYYNAANQLTQTNVVNTGGNLITTYGYDKRGLLTGVYDPRANVSGNVASNYKSSIAYDELRRPVTATSPPVATDNYGQATVTSPLTSSTGYDTFGNPVVTQGPISANGKTSVVYDALNRVTSMSQATNCCGGTSVTTSNSYDADGNTKTTVDQLGKTTSFDYDKLGRAVRVSDPLVAGQSAAGVRRFTYDDVNNLVKSVNQMGAVQAAAYDDLNRVRTATVQERTPAVANYTTNYTYDDLGNTIKAVDPGGFTIQATYDAAGNVRSSTDALGKISYARYDGNDNLTNAFKPSGQETAFSYDGANRLTKVDSYSKNYAVDRVTTYAYDAADNPKSMTDANGTTSTYTFDALNRMKQLVQPVSATKSLTTSFGYDADSNKTSVTDGAGNTTWSTYNALDLLASTIEPSTPAYPNAADRTWNYTYDAAGRVIGKVEPGAVATTNTFDELGRLKAVSATGGDTGTVTKSLAYNLASDLTSISTPTGTQSFVRNDRGLVVSQSGTLGASNFGYDARGLMTSRVNTAGTTNYTYNGRGQVATVADPLVAATYSFVYNSDSYLDSENVGSTWRIHTYDDWGREKSDTIGNTGGTNWRATAYGYDNLSNVTSKNFTFGSGGTSESNSYTYDKANRMLEAVQNGVPTGYTWSDNGNRTQSGSETFTYDARNRLLSDATSSYSYTARGTLKTQTATATGVASTYKFDSLNRLAYDPTDAAMASTGGLAYDALDRLVGRNSTTFNYDATSKDVVNDGAYKYTYRSDGEALSTKTGTSSMALAIDNHGDVIGGFAPGGSTTTNRTDYDPFGKVTSSAGAQASLGYQGSWVNQSSSQKHASAQTRWYMPERGQFASRDSFDVPVDSAIDTNLYTYAAANPLSNNDVAGQDALALNPRAFVGLGFALPAIAPAVAAAAPYVGAAALLTGAAVGGFYAGKYVGNAIVNRTVAQTTTTQPFYLTQTKAASGFIGPIGTMSVSTPRVGAATTKSVSSGSARRTTASPARPAIHRPVFNPGPAPVPTLGPPPLDPSVIVPAMEGPAIVGSAIDATLVPYIAAQYTEDPTCNQTMTCFAPQSAIQDLELGLGSTSSLFPNFRPENSGTCTAINTTANVYGLLAMSGIGDDETNAIYNGVGTAFGVGQNACSAANQSQTSKPDGLGNGVSRMSSTGAGGGPGNSGTGSLRIVGGNFSSSEQNVARTLAGQGRHVVLREADSSGPRTSDLIVDDIPYDVYTPRTGNIDRIVGAIAAKGNQVHGGGVVLDLSQSPLTAEQIGDILPRVRGVTTRVSDVIVLGGR